MKYVELYIKSLNKKQAQVSVPVPRTMFNLPGLRSAKDLDADEILRLKREYNIVLRGYQKSLKQFKSLKGIEKSSMRQQLKSTREHMDSLLIKIGTHTGSERVNGFKEINNAK